MTVASLAAVRKIAKRSLWTVLQSAQPQAGMRKLRQKTTTMLTSTTVNESIVQSQFIHYVFAGGYVLTTANLLRIRLAHSR